MIHEIVCFVVSAYAVSMMKLFRLKITVCFSNNLLKCFVLSVSHTLTSSREPNLNHQIS